MFPSQSCRDGYTMVLGGYITYSYVDVPKRIIKLIFIVPTVRVFPIYFVFYNIYIFCK